MAGGALKRVAGLPFSFLRLASGAKSFRDNPFIGSPRLNALGLHAARVRLAHRLAWSRRARLKGLMSAEDKAAFAQNGFIVMPDFLAPEAFDRLREQLLDQPYPAREMLQGDTVTRRIAVGPELLRRAPLVKTLLQDERWRGAMRYVASFASEPLYYVQTILTHRADAEPDPQVRLHADTFHPTLKAWYFLNDVAEEDGPLTYVPGSHLLTPERLAWERACSLVARDQLDFLSSRGSLRIAREELAGLGLPDPHRFAVPANTLVVVDTCGFHARAVAHRPSRRVELWAYGRRNPFLPWTGLDATSLGGVAERRVEALWRLRDVARRQLGQPWTPVGLKYPLQD
jgi:hypothetical protein